MKVRSNVNTFRIFCENVAACCTKTPYLIRYVSSGKKR